MSEQKKSTSKIALIIGSIVVIAIIVVALIMVLGGNSNQTPNHTHTYDEWKTVKDATCSQEGTKERYCSCGEKQTSSIAKSEHTYGEWLTDRKSVV